MKKTQALHFTSTLERSDNKLWGAHFQVPKHVAKKLIDGESRRVVCRLNDSVEYQCALLPHGEGTFVITVNKRLRDTLKLNFGDDVEVVLRKDKSEYGLPMPEEMQELFRQDREGDKLFHGLTRGRQRTLLYIINSKKDPDKRIASAITIVDHLKTNEGKINYKKLFLELKRPLV
jgi:bifunctional DNA-binding transcriptional regulator/antitoxin component of YhaV-PrlF toxin-antitoxin module